jgi:DNA polymerase III epsilon subunit-like protein
MPNPENIIHLEENGSGYVVCIDTETVSLFDHRPLEIGVCVGQWNSGEKQFHEVASFNEVINTEDDDEELKLLLMGHVSKLTFEEIRSGGREIDVLVRLNDFLSPFVGAVVVCHNTYFDVKQTLIPAFERHEMLCSLLSSCYCWTGQLNPKVCFDTCYSAYRALTSINIQCKRGRVSLSKLCTLFGVQQVLPEHRAISDARTLLHILNHGIQQEAYQLMPPFDDSELDSKGYRDLQILAKSRLLSASDTKENLKRKLRESRISMISSPL